ncbi:MAG: hypothetical protein IJZ68_07795 [Bacteroidaceae bacterium]|nr:hypothetical protein [Bacteroidaceae bacterium]
MALINREDFIAKLAYSTTEGWGKDIKALNCDFGRAVAIKDNFVRMLNEMPTYPEPVVAQKAGSVISSTGLMCTACYSNADRDAVFCKYCGAKFEEEKHE